MTSDAPELTAAVAKTLIVEGWRFLSHSYAIVNQWQLLALARRTDVAVKIIDAPFARSLWTKQERLFDEGREQALNSMALARRDESADVTLKIFAPYDFSPSPSRETAVFATSESQTLRRDQVADAAAFESLCRAPPADVKVVTPSHWSAQGFYRFGFKPEQVVIVPHGIDAETFRPMPDVRRSMRAALGIDDEEFVFLTVGAMTGNKGIDVLTRAFAEVSRVLPQTRLVLKGADLLYRSKDRLLGHVLALSEADQQRVAQRSVYIGEALSIVDMANLYQAADAYVSPYRAEGFNLPVLEAAACGIPVICTAGGPTDDFVTDLFARRIESTKTSHRDGDQELWRLEPDVDHLIALMLSTVGDDSWRRQAREQAPEYVAANHTWDRAVDLLDRQLLS
jgi:glycosyltransferase involved in cell wall biosynthesis